MSLKVDCIKITCSVLCSFDYISIADKALFLQYTNGDFFKNRFANVISPTQWATCFQQQ